MKDSHKTALSNMINQIVKSENEELILEMQRKQDRITVLNDDIKTLKKQVSGLENVWYSFAKYKAYYYTQFSTCPECNWLGWYDCWELSQSCDLCNSEWEVPMEKASKMIILQIENQIKSIVEPF